MAFDPFPGLLADRPIPFSTTLVPEKFLDAQSHDTPIHNYYYFLILLEAQVKHQAALQIHTTVQLPACPSPAEVLQTTQKCLFPGPWVFSRTWRVPLPALNAAKGAQPSRESRG